jgi:(2Fe-2S) ferredoxin
MSISSDKKILVCTNFRANPNYPSCSRRGSEEVLAALTKQSLATAIEKSPCMGMCHEGPNVRFVPNGSIFHAVSTKNLEKLIAEIKVFTAS